ncbi:hypothetical protein IC620_00270 [Hazenella sp. IB182357]|uniref:Uncharacterized protein n=1 Tax=Polycladospora coralii TaxID=2771432 RepID=A0A926NC15_9BACL|nr:hypothetical protein [Polycladospora coralii]MBD1370794.1 hypothetical protein [Polycladospora coralii]MBS7529733.1 hypothetical protein [Polycladospora coralii]
MNMKAAVFACNFTGVLALLASFFLWKVAGTSLFILGLVGSGFWFGLGWFFKRSSPDT